MISGKSYNHLLYESFNMALSKIDKLKVAAEFGFRCAYCRVPAYQIHHIIEEAQGGPDDFENLIPLCQICHLHYIHRKKLIKSSELYELKQNPIGFEDCEGFFLGPLGSQKTVVLGSCTLIDCHPIISYEEIPINLYFYCENQLGEPVIKFQEGEWVLGEGAFKFDRSPTHISIQDFVNYIDILKISLNQNSQLELFGKFYIKKNCIEISSNEFRINGLSVSGTTLENSQGFKISKDGTVAL
jgi:hypothetical protein